MVSVGPRGGQVCKNDRREMKVRKRMFFTTTVVAMVGVLIFGGTALAGKPGTGSVRMATLTGAEVVPTGSGDTNPNATGEVRLTLYPNKNKICYTIKAENIAKAKSAHLHEAPAGQNGPVKLRLLTPRADGTSRHECIRGLGERFIKKIGRNSSTGYYVGVHTVEPDKDIRGQLSR